MVNVKICIDPGHGGKDSGATNGSAYEKNINLAVALKLKTLLLGRGLEVLLTRETDVFNTVNEKARIANAYKADIFVSIHCNSAASVLAHGTETLVYSLTGDNLRLGETIQDKLVKSLKRANRGVKQRKDLAVLNSTNMAAALVELAFISNAEEKALLIDNTFQQKAAQAIYEGILDYIGLGEIETVSKIKINLNGVIKEVETINKDGYNYIKLRDLADDKITVGYDSIPIVKVTG